MAEIIYQCCENKPKYLITYSVAGENKGYSVCSSCSLIDCFRIHIVSKRKSGAVVCEQTERSD